MATAQDGFTEDERAAMKERAAELRTAKRRGTSERKAAADAKDAVDKIAQLPEEDRRIAERLHAIVTEHAPHLQPRTWYGMPAYAKDGQVVLFFKGASKFKVRYAEVGFNEVAALDDGVMWPTAYAVTAITAEVEAKLVELVTRAAG